MCKISIGNEQVSYKCNHGRTPSSQSIHSTFNQKIILAARTQFQESLMPSQTTSNCYQLRQFPADCLFWRSGKPANPLDILKLPCPFSVGQASWHFLKNPSRWDAEWNVRTEATEEGHLLQIVWDLLMSMPILIQSWKERTWSLHHKPCRGARGSNQACHIRWKPAACFQLCRQDSGAPWNLLNSSCAHPWQHSSCAAVNGRGNTLKSTHSVSACGKQEVERWVNTDTFLEKILEHIRCLTNWFSSKNQFHESQSRSYNLQICSRKQT